MNATETIKQRFDRAIALLIENIGNPDLQRPPKPRKGDGATVYFFRAGSYVKIGYSVDPRTRLGQIRNGDGTKCPADIDRKTIRLVQTEPGGRSKEYELHQKFKHLHHFGEWFTEAPELTDYINSLAEGIAA